MSQKAKQTMTDDKANQLAVIPGGKRDRALVTEESARMTRDQVALMRRQLCPDLTEDEAALYVHFANSCGADPLKRETWAQVRFVKAKDQWGNDKIQNGRQVYERRLVMGLSKNKVQQRLEERMDFAGIQSAVVYDKDEFTADLGSGYIKHIVKSLLKKDRGMMIAAWCKISRTNKEPYVRILDLAERKQDTGSYNWKSMPETMLLKCVEMDAVRACYPKELGTVYDEAEADTFGERLDPSKMEEHQPEPPLVDSTVKDIQEFSQALPSVSSEPPAAAFVTDIPTQGGAFVSDEQIRGLKSMMEEFHLIPADFGAILKKLLSRDVKSVADVRKPEYQTVAKAFEKVREGTLILSGGKLFTVDEIAEFKKDTPEDSLPF